MTKSELVTSVCSYSRLFFRLYKFVEDAYTHANHTLLRLLLQDQQLIPRLRSLKRYFFLSQSSFLTHLLDLAHTELKKPAKSASIVKLQSLLDLALTGEDALFREDVKVNLAGTALYEWLLKVISVSGVIDDGEGVLDGAGQEDVKKDRDKEKDEKKPMLGKTPESMRLLFQPMPCSHRSSCARLYSEIPPLPCNLAQDHLTLSIDLSLPFASKKCRAVSGFDVD